MTTWLAALLCGCTPQDPAARAPDDLPSLDAPAPEAPAEPSRPEAIEVLYRGASTEPYVFMLAVDTARGRALVENSSTVENRFAFEVVDYAEHVREERWEATPENARSWTPAGNQFAPVSSSREADLAHLGAILASMDPQGLSGWPPIAVSPDGSRLAYTEDDRLWLADRDGKRLRLLSAGQRAGYQPAFSPDGNRIAWIGTARGQGYGLYVATLSGEAHRVEATDTPAVQPCWSPDGEWIYVQDTQIGVREHGPVCLSAVSVDGRARLGRPHRLGCVEDVTQAHVFFDPTGQTAVTAGWLAGTERAVRYVWFDLPTGEVRATLDLEEGGLLPLLTQNGRILVGLKGGTWLVDLVTGERALAQEQWHLDTGVYGHHETDGRLILLRSWPDRAEGVWAWEIVRLDPDALLPPRSPR